jgi:hypothetical protein
VQGGWAYLPILFFFLCGPLPAAEAPSPAEAPPPAPGEGAVVASNGRPPAYRIPRTAAPIIIDGVLDDAAWNGALGLELAHEVEPGENLPAPVRTEALLTYDDQSIYVAFRAHEPEPGGIRAHLSDRDGAFRDDWVGVAVDPFNDERRGFMLLANPLGVQMDLSRNDVGPGDLREDPSWDAIWSAAGRITAGGYEVEMAIPFTSLRFQRVEGEQTWGLQLLRTRPRTFRQQFGLVPQDRNRDCFFCQAAKLEGFSGIRPGRNLEFDPTLTTGRTDEREPFPAGPLAHGSVEVDPGLSARWSVTPNLSLNAAINPDFSQVEADVAQLDVNTRFALFFPEKRPFFMEGADFFNTPLNAVYTRTVTEPAFGGKVTGKEGRHALGFALGRDRKTALIFPSNQESDDEVLDLDHDVGILRYRYDIGRNSTVGLLGAGRQGGDYRHGLYGADAHLMLTDTDTLRLQALRSTTRYPTDVAAAFGQPAGTLEDGAIVARYIHAERDWFWFAMYEDLGRDFRADTGFLPRVDTRKAELILERTFWGGSGDWYSRLIAGVSGSRIEDHDGLLTDRDVGVHGLIFGPAQSFLFARLARREEYFEGVLYDQSVAEFEFNITPSGGTRLALNGRFGDAIDYDNGRAGRLVRLTPGATVAAGRRLTVQLDHTFERLEVAGGRLYEANLSQLRAVWQFDLRTFVRLILQHTGVKREPSLYLDPVESHTRDLLGQFLFSYKINPQTLVFVGYSDSRTDETADHLTIEDRTFFIKLGYAWVM